MTVFNGETADDVWQAAAKRLEKTKATRQQKSRAGETREILHAGFSIADPTQRWVTTRRPGLSIAFAIAEVVWIMQGRNDSEFLNFWNPKLPEFAGRGPKYHGAYGHRLRHQFGVDQIERAYQALDGNPPTRQVVLQIYHPEKDLPNPDGSPAAPDVPCNVTAMLKVRDGALEWTQILRSNDLFLGVPYNFVQFTHVQEILAGWLELDIGSYTHFSDSLHIYTRNLSEVTDSIRAGDSAPPPRNPDSLRFPYKESQRYLEGLESRIEDFISAAGRGDIQKATRWPDAPQSIQNLLFVLGADAARRNELHDLSERIMGDCTNPVYTHLWQQWTARFDPTAKTT